MKCFNMSPNEASSTVDPWNRIMIVRQRGRHVTITISLTSDGVFWVWHLRFANPPFGGDRSKTGANQDRIVSEIEVQLWSPSMSKAGFRVERNSRYFEKIAHNCPKNSLNLEPSDSITRDLRQEQKGTVPIAWRNALNENCGFSYTTIFFIVGTILSS